MSPAHRPVFSYEYTIDRRLRIGLEGHFDQSESQVLPSKHGEHAYIEHIKPVKQRYSVYHDHDGGGTQDAQILSD